MLCFCFWDGKNNDLEAAFNGKDNYCVSWSDSPRVKTVRQWEGSRGSRSSRESRFQMGQECVGNIHIGGWGYMGIVLMADRDCGEEQARWAWALKLGPMRGQKTPYGHDSLGDKRWLRDFGRIKTFLWAYFGGRYRGYKIWLSHYHHQTGSVLVTLDSADITFVLLV